LKETQLSPSQFEDLLEQLGYVERGNKADAKLIEEAEEILQNRLTRENVFLFLCQVEKINMSWMQPGKQEEEKTHGGLDKEGKFKATPEDAKRIQKHFSSFVYKRGMKEIEIKKAKAEADSEQYQYKP